MQLINALWARQRLVTLAETETESTYYNAARPMLNDMKVTMPGPLKRVLEEVTKASNQFQRDYVREAIKEKLERDLQAVIKAEEEEDRIAAEKVA